MAGLLANPLFRSAVAGAGFFADSYDLFITDGVGNILKGLGPSQAARFSAAVTPACAAQAAAAFGVLYNASDASPVQVVSGAAGYATFVCWSAGNDCLSQAWADAPTCALVPSTPALGGEVVPLYQAQTTYLKNGLNNAASFGNVFGQLLFGVLGDLLGRRTNFIITSCLIIVGCLGAASAAGGTPIAGARTAWGLWASTAEAPAPAGAPQHDVYGQLFFWRALLGLGVGGEYPLASTITSEASTSAARGAAVLSIFSMQGFGKLTAALVNFLCVSGLRYYGGPWAADATWRFAFAFGCVPNLLTLFWRFKMVESEIYKDAAARERGGGGSGGGGEGGAAGAALPLKTTLACLWEYRYTLLGTASTWFLIDVTFYGQSLMNTTVINNAVASTAGLNSIDKLRVSLRGTVLIMLIALPGYFFAIALIERMGRLRMTHMGFLLSAVCFAVVAGGYESPLRTAGGGAGFVFVYGLTYFFANFGPNSTTFLMPVEAFPTRIRATSHGISAAVGKVGAIVGSMGLLAMWYSSCSLQLDGTGARNCTAAGSPTPAQQAQADAGLVDILWLCAGVSLAGSLMTFLFVRETGFRELADVDDECETLRRYDALLGGEGGGGGKGRGAADATEKTPLRSVATL